MTLLYQQIFIQETFLHISVSVYTKSCTFHMTMWPWLAWWITHKCRVSTPDYWCWFYSSTYRLQRAHFSYLLPCAVIGLQLGQDPMSLLQHGADLVPHGCLCLRGLGICQRGGKQRGREGARSESGMQGAGRDENVQGRGEVIQRAERKWEGEKERFAERRRLIREEELKWWYPKRPDKNLRS